ncbi:MAG: hypothetical protein IJF05_05015, partial [Clostridia bacterium]|nr:hypothetical protein [Clostridia bacterium]
RVRNGENVIFNGYLYALTAELAALRPFKGETHCHTNRSDGVNEPYELMLRYFAAGFDFAAVTDHHKYAPSVEARKAMTPLSDMFTVFHGEEVHNKSMGYFHVVNFGGEYSINEIIQNNDEYVNSELSRIKSERSFPEGVNPELAAYRIFISNEIRRAGGVSILAHPFWEAYGEYNMERRELEYHLTHGVFDALELFAGNDNTGNGDNLEIALWGDLRALGVKTPVLGASDNHNPDSEQTRFNRNLSLVFARDTDDIPNAIKRGSVVAVKRRTDTDFLVIGEYSLVAYARFLLAEMYPTYAKLTARIAEEIKNAGCRTENAAALEMAAIEYRNRFFAQGINR